MPARALALLPAVAATALGAAGCGGEADPAKPPSARTQQRPGGAPAPAAGRLGRAGTLLPAGADALRRRLRSLRGRPVVVNKWASWCVPCRYESSVLRRVSAKLGKRVAFLGIAARDEAPAARRVLARRPVPYPSYFDPRERIAASVGMPAGFPLTNFYDSRGRLVHRHAGPFAADLALEREIARYARR